MESLKDSTIRGMAYPLNSSRIKLRHIQHLASTLDLPTTAPRSDLEVMIEGKLVENKHDKTSVQVVIAQGEEGEQLSLRDMNGTFLVTPPLPILASKSPTPSREDYSYEEEIKSFTAEMTQLRNVLQMLEEEAMVLRTELQSTKEEVEQLRTELNKSNNRLVELWQENCKQLLDHDIVMAEKEKEVQLLREQLQVREFELARLKLANLREAATIIGTTSEAKTVKVLSQTVAAGEKVGELSSRSTKHSLVALPVMPTRGSLSTSSKISMDGTPRSCVTPLQVLSGQRGHVSTTITTTTVNLSPSPCVVTLSTTNPFQEGDNVTEPPQLSLATVPLAQPWVTNTIPGISETHLGSKSKGTQSLGEINKQSSISQDQSNQQVTNLNTSLSDTLFISRPISSIGTVNHGKLTAEGHAYTPRRGKAPPIDPFTAEDIGITFDDWLPILERAATWNEWAPEESLMQLAGHLRGRALQEWKLLLPEERATYQSAIKALKERLDPGNQTLAALDFRHLSQKMNESVSDFIGRLEKVFQTGFGREHLSNETREMLLYGQLQEGLSYTLMESPAVSGAQNYKELCLAARREERRLAELRKKQQYLKDERPRTSNSNNRSSLPSQKWLRSYRRGGNYRNVGNKSDKEGTPQQKQLRCYICDSPNHLARQCQHPKTESPGKKIEQTKTTKTPGTRVI
ncbi:MAG: hypothetical protein OXG81_05455 [Acidobacteria bacterium]|nr:hypothetical protein [Acidobacteriota bacterium]